MIHFGEGIKMGNFENRILKIIDSHPNGIKAKDIAQIMGCDRKDVNSALFGRLKGLCIQDNEYTAHPAFDGIRRWIVSGENDEGFNYLPSISVERNKLAYALPENAHFCVFIQMDGEICALVSFYGRYTRQFTFGPAPAAEDFKYPDGYICDWKNKTEYTLAEHIECLIGNARSKLETPY